MADQSPAETLQKLLEMLGAVTVEDAIERLQKQKSGEFAMRVAYQVVGIHVHATVRIGKKDRTRALSGQLIMRKEEFDAWRFGEVPIDFIESAG
jgi:hypothetical protein